MNKTEYIMRQLAKTNKKNYENYVVTRIWHHLNDLDVKFVTQQYVTRPGKGRALTDMYFPQIGLHIEVDEAQHFTNAPEGLKRVSHDLAREADIINATNHKIVRIVVEGEDIDSINKQIDNVIDLIKIDLDVLRKNGLFEKWNIEAEYNPQTYIDKKYIDIEDGVAFRTVSDACNCFGHNYAGYQRGIANHPHEFCMIWFPKLYENGNWINSISDDENTIFEKRVTDNESHVEAAINQNEKGKSRIVFARVRGPLGDVMYRFRGKYKLDEKLSKIRGAVVYVRTHTRVNTYKCDLVRGGCLGM